MQPLTFRPCRPEDANLAVPLIYSSGPAAFDYTFCDSDAQQSRAFLRKAFERGHSEFNYRQHTAAILDGKLAGVGVRALYRRRGFIETHRRRGRLVSPFGRVVDHCRMELPMEKATRTS